LPKQCVCVTNAARAHPENLPLQGSEAALAAHGPAPSPITRHDLRNDVAGFNSTGGISIPLDSAQVTDAALFPAPAFPPSTLDQDALGDANERIWPEWRCDVWHEVGHLWEHQVNDHYASGDDHTEWRKAIRQIATKLSLDPDKLKALLASAR